MKVRSLDSTTYDPRSNDRKPVKETAYDQTKVRPSTDAPRGLAGGLFPNASGGDMNTGGKRRPYHDASKGID